MRIYDRKHYFTWKAKWELALKEGFCPIANCSLEKQTCPHLDQFLAYDPGAPKFEPEIFATAEIDEFPQDESKGQGVWALFKQLRKYPLKRDQIGVLIRKFALNYSFSQIAEEMNWVSTSMAHSRYMRALKKLKKHGFDLEAL